MLLYLILGLATSEYIEYDLDSKMSLGWEISGETIYLTFTCRIGWCGIGFGDSMVNSDMIIVSFQESDAIPTVMDCWSHDNSLPPTDVSLLGSDNLEITNFSKKKDTFTVRIERPLYTEDIFDYRIDPEEKFSISWAYLESGQLSKHSTSAVGEIRMGSTSESSYFKAIHDAEFQKYGIIMSSLWGVLAPMGIFIARYFKWWKYWYEAHLILFGIVVILTVISANLVILTVKNVYNELDYVTIYHSRMGFTIACLVIGHCLLYTSDAADE